MPTLPARLLAASMGWATVVGFCFFFWLMFLWLWGEMNALKVAFSILLVLGIGVSVSASTLFLARNVKARAGRYERGRFEILPLWRIVVMETTGIVLLALGLSMPFLPTGHRLPLGIPIAMILIGGLGGGLLGAGVSERRRRERYARAVASEPELPTTGPAPDAVRKKVHEVAAEDAGKRPVPWGMLIKGLLCLALGLAFLLLGLFGIDWRHFSSDPLMNSLVVVFLVGPTLMAWAFGIVLTRRALRRHDAWAGAKPSIFRRRRRDDSGSDDRAP